MLRMNELAPIAIDRATAAEGVRARLADSTIAPSRIKLLKVIPGTPETT